MNQGLVPASSAVERASSAVVFKQLPQLTDQLKIKVASYAVLYKNSKVIHLRFKFILEKNVFLPNKINITFANTKGLILEGNFDLYSFSPDGENSMQTQTVVMYEAAYLRARSEPSTTVTFLCNETSSSFSICI